MMTQILLVGVAGGCGSLARWGLSALIHAAQTSHPAPTQTTGSTLFPWPTLVVNLLGCLAFGLVYALTESRHVAIADLRLYLLTGFMGAFTTFSTFEFEILGLLRRASTDRTALWMLAGYLALSIAGGLALAALGLWTGHLVKGTPHA